MSKNRQPTIVDVAKEAGVSIATVSNVLNRRNVPLTEETIRKVEQAVKRLGYRRNVMAANLSSRKSNELGLIIPNFVGYYGRFAEELEQKFHRNGYHLSVFSSNGMNPDLERRHIELLLQRRADGLVCHGLAMSVESTRQIVGEGTPLVIFNGWGWPSDIASLAVNLDFAEASKEAVRHLVEQGCLCVYYAANTHSLGANAQREQGFRVGMLQYAADAVSAVLDAGELGVEGLIDEVLRLSGDHRPIGIYAFNDVLALQILSACQARGFRIPEEIKLVGMDNELYSQASYPAITSFHMPVEEQTRLITSWLLQQLGEELEAAALELLSGIRLTADGRRQIDLPLTLVPRRSSEAGT
ncbi:LacI family DNA-binding transcriptional regulator [Paenibacillus sp. GP183]|uniref:LacI family DNA-binding transcriptional regulator n=1 Tax=Paenibacillus sp. GP183 TaxID=1882751 RepID=UPI00089AD9A9|nr:LacI family DNA-binding transcriptional regulator [Paenibacillus sp. GP183]SEC67125.1 LacI family transcriptional regulator/LacI family transcriptional regulator, sucrose operon repressor [Paenibacillus sp. GP183]